MSDDFTKGVLAERERIRRGVVLIARTDEEDGESHSLASLDRDLDEALSCGARLTARNATHPFLAQLGDA